MEETEQKKKEVKAWLNNKYNLAFLGIFLFAIILRFYYFWITKSQPLWWDESDYMAFAKNLAGYNVFWKVTPQHMSLFPYIVAFFFKIGFSDVLIKFILEVIPAIALVYLTYKICILLYADKRIALISSFLISIFWELIFYCSRYHLEALGLMFGFLSIYVFFKGEKNERIFSLNHKWAVPLTVFLVVLTYSIRRGFFLFGIFFLIYMLFTRNFKEMIKDKYNLIALGIFLISFLFVENFIFTSPITQVAGTYYNEQTAINLSSFSIFSAFFSNIFNPVLSPLLYLFWIGFIILIIKFILRFGYFKKSELEEKSNLFFFIMLFVVLAYFTFYQRNINGGEPRWYYPLLLGCFICISQASLFISDYIKKYSKPIAVIVIIGLIGFGGYYEYKHADYIIQNKITSYQGIKDASLYLKEISNKNDIIISVPVPQTAYYAERNVLGVDDLTGITEVSKMTLDSFLEKIREDTNVKYVIVSFSEPNHPSFMRKENEEYALNSNGQQVLAKWEIPFMDTTIDFINNKEDIISEKTYGDIRFRLLTIKQEVFIYIIERTTSSSLNSTPL